MEYYYTKKENVDPEKKQLVVDDFEFKHLVKVLRKQPGEEITITDGECNIYHCIIKIIGKDKIHCEITGTDFNLFEPKVNVSLYISPLRNAARFEFAIEKAVELGIYSIHPVITDYTVNKNIPGRSKSDRLKKIIISAMSQSQRCFLPVLYDTVTFSDMISNTKDLKNKIVMYEFSDDRSGIKPNNETEGLSVLIGPEGGFSENEISLLKENNWQVKSLGERKLRAETAAIVSIFDIISKPKLL
ncbi:MAG: 16S rRNA (uracil(1498)-N(3))-methyltransferase [Ignavibacteria bacterium]|nr:16S rRNA (uracil(1498)-N(3))-methyltransferase [Ignavibacteria bacterium]